MLGKQDQFINVGLIKTALSFPDLSQLSIIQANRLEVNT